MFGVNEWCGQPVGSPVEEEINHLRRMEMTGVCVMIEPEIRRRFDGGGLDEVSGRNPRCEMQDAG